MFLCDIIKILPSKNVSDCESGLHCNINPVIKKGFEKHFTKQQ